MGIIIREVSFDEYTQRVNALPKPVPLWLDSKFIDCYKDKLILLAVSGKEIKGIWVVPTIIIDGVVTAKRNYRFLPYASPIIFETDNLKRREVMLKLFEYVVRKCKSVYLPLAPGFNDISIIQSRGALVEWRSTHVLHKSLIIEKIDGRLRNHIRFARNNVEFKIVTDPKTFKFGIAIKGNDEEVRLRKKLALKLLKSDQAIIINAYRNNILCAGIFLAFDKQAVYMMHSWQSKKAPRGTISGLIFEAVDWTFNTMNLKIFDFEGSVIKNIDYFFCGFNAEILPYGYIHWSTSKDDLCDLINRSLSIEGRMTYESD